MLSLTQAYRDIRVRTLTGKEIELDIEPDYKVRPSTHTPYQTPFSLLCLHSGPPGKPRHPFTSQRKLSSEWEKADVCQVSRIKERVEEKEGIPPVQQRLIFGGKQMYVSIVLLLHYVLPLLPSHSCLPTTSSLPSTTPIQTRGGEKSTTPKPPQNPPFLTPRPRLRQERR